MSLISGELRGADDWRPSCALTEMSDRRMLEALIMEWNTR